MPDFLSSIPFTYENVSPGFVETLIQSRREDLFTGLMHLTFPSGEIFDFTFLDGAGQKLYRCLETSTEVIPRRSWSAAMDLPNASVSFMPMTVESVRLISLAHEAPITRVDEHTLTVPQLSEHVAEWSKSTEATILHVRATPSDRLYLISGFFNPVIESITFANGASNFSINDISFPALFAPGDHRITRYVSDREHVSWQDYELRLAFNPLMRLLLNRFSELAGRMLTERLCEQISSKLKDEGWNIKVTLNGVSNRQYFESMEKSVDVYVDMIRSFHDEASPAIGQRMAEGLFHEVLAKLDAYRRETILRHIFNDDHVDKVTGRVWR